jgi:hypothetical protein
MEEQRVGLRKKEMEDMTEQRIGLRERRHDRTEDRN